MSGSRQAAAVARLSRSRERLHQALLAPSTGGGLGEQVAGMVLRHPLGAALVALLVGALVTRARPWRWALKPAVWAVIVPQAVAALAAAPMGLWINVLTTLWHRHAGASDGSAGVPADAPADVAAAAPVAAPAAATPGAAPSVTPAQPC